jgi:hypothetical protein
MSPIYRSHLIRRAAGVLTGLAALLAPITTGSAAFASPLQADPPAWFQRLPPMAPGWNKHPPLLGPAHVHAALAAVMPGWQITLIAAGAAVLAVTLAVLLTRARAARRQAAAYQAGRPGRDGLAERSSQDVTAAANVAAGDQLAPPDHRSRPAGGRWAGHPPSAVPGTGSAGQNWPAPTATMSRLLTVIAPGPLSRTVQLCIHCRQSPAGFWVSRTGGQTVRRPWCLSCCQGLDRDRCDVIPFDS